MSHYFSFKTDTGIWPSPGATLTNYLLPRENFSLWIYQHQKQQLDLLELVLHAHRNRIEISLSDRFLHIHDTLLRYFLVRLPSAIHDYLRQFSFSECFQKFAEIHHHHHCLIFLLAELSLWRIRDLRDLEICIVPKIPGLF